MIKNSYKKNSQQTWLFYHYLFLLLGFFGGNLWGSFFSSFYLPPFFFVIGILLCLEILSYIYYKKISLPFSGFRFDATALPEKPRPGTRRVGGWRALLCAFRARKAPRRVAQKVTFRAQQASPCLKAKGKGTVSKSIQGTNAKPIQQVNQNKSKFKQLSISNGFLPFVFIDFKFNKTKGFSKKRLELTNNLNNSLNLVQNRNKSLYLLKVGLVFGLFVDAFKVGS